MSKTSLATVLQNDEVYDIDIPCETCHREPAYKTGNNPSECLECMALKHREAQAIATEEATLKRVGEWLDNINLEDYDLEGLKYFIIVSTRELKQGDFPT